MEVSRQEVLARPGQAPSYFLCLLGLLRDSSALSFFGYALLEYAARNLRTFKLRHTDVFLLINNQGMLHSRDCCYFLEL